MDWFQAAKDELETYFDIEQTIPEEEIKERGVRAINAFHHIFVDLAAKLKLRDGSQQGSVLESRQSTL